MKDIQNMTSHTDIPGPKEQYTIIKLFFINKLSLFHEHLDYSNRIHVIIMLTTRRAIKGFPPEWCISTIYHAWNTPFWSGILKILQGSIFPILAGLLQSSSSHNQPSWTFKLLHANLEQNNCTSSIFPVEFNIIPCFEQICPNALTHDDVTYIYIYHKIMSAVLSPDSLEYYLCWINFCMSFNKSTGCGNILNITQINIKICKEMDTTKFVISYATVTLNEGQSSKLISKCRALWSLSSYQVWKKLVCK